MSNQIKFSLLEGEQLLAEVAANRFRNVEVVSGLLKITNQRVLFEPHLPILNNHNFTDPHALQHEPIELAMSDIAAAGPRNTMGLVPNGLLVTTRAGVEYKFALWGRDKIIAAIQTHIPNA